MIWGVMGVVLGVQGEKVETKKGTKKPGRPKEDSGKGTVLKMAPTSWRAVQPLSLTLFLCIVDRAVKTLCDNLVCAECISSLILDATSTL